MVNGCRQESCPGESVAEKDNIRESTPELLISCRGSRRTFAIIKDVYFFFRLSQEKCFDVIIHNIYYTIKFNDNYNKLLIKIRILL